MSLRQQAAADHRAILEDSAAGFGWPITVTDPSGHIGSLVGFANDVGQAIDPETGQLVTGRKASVRLAIASLTAAGLALPSGVADTAGKPWVVAFDDITGARHTFKVSEARVDRTLGAVDCMLEKYAP